MVRGGTIVAAMARAARDPRDELYDAYASVPPHQHAEIVRGTLYVMSRPAPRHANAASMLGAEIGGPFQRGRGGPGGWWILDEPELHLVAKEPVVPDLAGWRVERMPELPETAYFTLVPDWVCEVPLALDRKARPGREAAALRRARRAPRLASRPDREVAGGVHARRRWPLARSTHASRRHAGSRRAVRRDRAGSERALVTAAHRVIATSVIYQVSAGSLSRIRPREPTRYRPLAGATSTNFSASTR